MTKRFFTSKEAAEYVGYCESSLRTFRVKGGGPVFIKHGRKVLYDRADLDAWIQGGSRKGSTSEPDKPTVSAAPSPPWQIDFDA